MCYEPTAQPQPETRQSYLDHIGSHETAVEIEKTLTSILNRYAGFLPGTRKEQIADFFSFVLTVNGYTSEVLETLSDEGLNIGHALTADNRPLVEQSLMADVAIKGTVQGEKWINDPSGDQIREVNIQVLDIFKGELNSETITIRQRNGREYGENPAEAALLESGKTYLLLLNNGLFRYAVFRNTGNFAESQAAKYANYFSIYRHYEMSNKRILWSGYNKRKSKKALEDIRWLDSFTD